MSYATPRSAMPSVRANGNIACYRFVEIVTGTANSVTQANAAGDYVWGVTTGVEKYPPGTPGATAGRHAEAGDTVDLIGWGEVALLEIGSGGVTQGRGVVSDANGAGVAVGATAGSTFHAIALETAAEGDIARVWVCAPNQLPVT